MAVVELGQTNFDDVVMKAELPVLVDFWASWCNPCRMMGPIVAEVAEQLDGQAIVAKVNIDQEPDLAARYRVMSIPTLLVFKNGQVVNKSVGVIPAKSVLALLNA